MAIAPLQIPQANINSSADFSPLANLGEVYKKSQNERRLSDLGKQLAGGNITYQQAAGQVADMGDINSTLKFLALAEQQKQKGLETQASANFQRTMGGLYGGGAAQTIAAPPTVGVNPAPGLMPDPAVSTPRAPVASSPKVWGDQEAEDAGLYDPAKPAQVAQAVPSAAPAATAAPAPAAPAAPAEPAPSFGDRFAAARPTGVAPNVSQIPMLLGALSDPNLPAGQKDVAKLLLNKALDDAKVPEKIQTLTALKEQSGFKGSLLDLELLLRKSQANSQNVTIAGEKKYEETINKDLGEEFVNIQKQGRAASDTKGTLDLMERAAKMPGFDSGTLPNVTNAVKRGLVSLGVADAESAKPNEIFDKLSNKLVLDLSGGKLGTGFSNADRDFMQMTTANRQNTPEGNLGIINIQRKITERQRVVAQMARDYARAHKGKIDYEFYDTLDKYAQQNPLFPEASAPAATAAPAASGRAKTGVPYTVEPDQP